MLGRAILQLLEEGVEQEQVFLSPRCQPRPQAQLRARHRYLRLHHPLKSLSTSGSTSPLPGSSPVPLLRRQTNNFKGVHNLVRDLFARNYAVHNIRGIGIYSDNNHIRCLYLRN
jgi:hypothetical protein